jgi:hypothetical protein
VPLAASSSRKVSLLEWVVLAAAWASSMLILGAIGWRVAVDGLSWSGSIGGLAEDTMQYLSWARDSSQHLLASNYYTLAPSSRSYFHPGIAISGLLHRLGVSIPVAYAVWVPVAAAAVCWGAFGFVRENIVEPGERVVALVLALFYAFPAWLISSVLPAAQSLTFTAFISREPQTLSPMWGYPYSALAVGLTALSLVTYIRARRIGKSFSPALIALVILTGWLQPWQGATTIATLVAAELLLRARRFSSLTPATPKSSLLGPTAIVAGMVPLVYYALLGRLDSTFIESERNLIALVGAERWWMILLAVLPLLLPALLAARIKVTDVAGLTARVWPVMAIAQALALAQFSIASSPSHALRGVAIPLSVLAVTGTSNLLRSRQHWLRMAAAVTGIGLFAVIGTVHSERTELNAVFGSGLTAISGRYFLTEDQLNAFGWLADSKLQGGVLGDAGDLGSMVPWRTGRKVWIGHAAWSPKSVGRFDASRVILSGTPCCTKQLFGMRSGRFVQATGARFVLVDCFLPINNILAQLGDAVEAVHRFGCVNVVQIRPGTSAIDAGLVNYAYGASESG